jgi:hypothetical protein
VDGYKRHVLRDLDSRRIVAVGVTPANAPEASVTDAIEIDLAAQYCTLHELHIDRITPNECPTQATRPWGSRRQHRTRTGRT